MFVTFCLMVLEASFQRSGQSGCLVPTVLRTMVFCFVLDGRVQTALG